MSFRTVHGSTHSENGWRLCDRDECDTVDIPNLHLVDTAPIRKGAPLTILGAWIYWYDRNVEEILTPVWGWSLTNDVLGSYGNNNGSNHLAGTGVDICAPKYPWGIDASVNMSPARINRIRQGMSLFSVDGSLQNSVIYWGQDWFRKDPMHYQLRFPEGDPRNEQFAKQLHDGHLGIYQSGPHRAHKSEVVTMTKRFPEDWTDREILIDILQQLRGYGLSGHSQLGKNDRGQNLTVVDKLASG